MDRDTRRKWQRHEQRTALAKHQEEVRQDVIARIERLKKADVPFGEHLPKSMGAEIEQWQISQGYKTDYEKDRESLPQWQKDSLRKMTLDAMQKGNQTYEGAEWIDGKPFKRGFGGALIPVEAYPDVRDADDFAVAQKQNKKFAKTAERLWHSFNLENPDLDYDEVKNAAGLIMQGTGFDQRQMNDFLSDDYNRSELFSAIRSVAISQRAGQGNHVMADDDQRTVTADNIRTAGGAPRQQQTGEELGSMTSDLINFQKQAGIRR